MPRKSGIIPYSTRAQDYPAMLSDYERESLAAEATLAAKKKPKKLRKPRQRPSGRSAT